MQQKSTKGHILKKIVILLALLSQLYSAQWRWSCDTLEPTDDKQVHAVGSFGLYYMLVHKSVKPNQAIAVICMLGLTKESVDALVPWELYGRIGGDGFSKNDIIYNLIGLVSAYITDNSKTYKIGCKNNEITFSYLL